MSENLPVPAPDDRYVPTEYEGKIEPNWYCRGWNAPREKYCRARAGQGTDHPGVGRCTNHGGSNPIKHGFRSVITRPRIAELVAYFEAIPDDEALRTFPELAAARALFVDWVERYDQVTDALLAWHASYETGDGPTKPRQMPDIADGQKILDTISKIVERIHKADAANAISRKDFFRVMGKMGRTVELCNDEPDPEKRLRMIKHGWQSIRLA